VIGSGRGDERHFETKAKELQNASLILLRLSFFIIACVVSV
jgi:hypothetical protein